MLQAYHNNVSNHNCNAHFKNSETGVPEVPQANESYYAGLL